MSLEKLGIYLPEDELKKVLTNRELAIEQLETIVEWWEIRIWELIHI